MLSGLVSVAPSIFLLTSSGTGIDQPLPFQSLSPNYLPSPIKQIRR